MFWFFLNSSSGQPNKTDVINTEACFIVYGSCEISDTFFHVLSAILKMFVLQ